jgi:hypothetical protein
MTVELTYIFEVDYDSASDDFQEAFKSYREVINSNADEEDFLKNAVYQAHRRGGDSLLEGIGYVKVNGRVEDEEMYCGIDLYDDDPDPEIEIY